MRASGTNTASRIVSWLCVGRMPRVSQVSTTVTPGLVRSTKACTICGPPGASASIGMGSEPGPRRAVRAELLAAGQAVAALDPFGPARRQQDRDVVAGLGVAGGEHLAVERGVEHPAQRVVAGPVELGGDADPVRVHGHRQRRRRGVASETALAGGHLGEVEAPSAEVRRHGRGQVADVAELGEVVVEVGVGPVELAGAGAEAFQQFDGQFGQLAGSWSWWRCSWRRRCAMALTPRSHRLASGARP